MSSVRINPHVRAAASSVGEASRGEASAGRASFAVALGAAALFQKGSGAELFAGKENDTTDPTPPRKRTEGGGETDTAAALAGQGMISAAVVGQPSAADVAETAERATPEGISDDVFAAGSGVGQLAPDTVSTAASPSQAGELADGAAQPGVDTTSPSPGDVGLKATALSPALRPGLQAGPSPAGTDLAERSQALAATAFGQADAGGAEFGGRERGRFAPVAAAPVGSAAGNAIISGGTADTTELVAASAAAPANSADPSVAATISEQVAGHVVRLAASGLREMVMQLHPPELGEVTVRLVINGRDVSAWFGSPQPQVQIAITDGIGQLQTGLDGAGYNLNGAWVGADASGTGGQRSQVLPTSIPAPTGVAADLDTGLVTASRPAASAVNVYV
jgi:flagellar hook-length control protein FliK